MPILSTQIAIQGILDGLPVPGDAGVSGPLVALITPYDPDESGQARAYIWPATGPERRLAMPRNTGPGTAAGWKQIHHSLQVFLVWFGADNQDQDSSFPAFIDAVMDALRTAPNPLLVTDPETGLISQMVNIGETMTYEFPPPRSTADQRILRYDCRIAAEVFELFQR